jgi:hypothetical protein
MSPIREIPLSSPPLPKPPGGPSVSAASAAPTPHSAFARLVAGFASEADRGEATVRGVLEPARGGAPMDSMHLLALQAGIYRYGETMDLAARLVDKASSGVKTVVQGQ